MQWVLFAAASFPTMAIETISETDSEMDSIHGYDIDELVVTGTRAPKTLKDTPVQTILISNKDIVRTDATDIEDLLQQEIPGVEFNYAMNQQVHMNFGGFGGQGVLFLVDGERLAGETMDDVDFTRMDMNDVERVEIVRGASSALYGSSAGGGVVNIITKKASRIWDLNLNARVAKHGEQRYGLSLSNKYKWLQNVLTGSFYKINNYDVTSAEKPATRTFSTVYGNTTWNVRDRLTVTPIDKLRITANAGFFYRQLARVEDSPERYRDFSGGLKGEWDISDNDFLTLGYHFDQYDKSDYHKISHLDIREYSNVQNSLRMLYNHSFGRGDILTAGADYMHDYLMNTKLTERTRTQDSFDAFLQYDWIINKRWELVAAARYDYFSDGKLSNVTPKISGRYSPIDNLNIRLAYGMGFRAPSLKEKYYNFDMSGIWIVKGNPYLKPEKSHNINMSLDYTKRNYNITVTGYFNQVHNKITTGVPYSQPDDPHQLYLDYENLADYQVCGADITLQGSWDCGISAKISYSYTYEKANKTKDGNEANNQYMPARPHSLTMRCDWNHDFSKNYHFTAGINGRVLSSVSNIEYRDYYDISQGTVTVNYPAYTIWKLSIGQTFWNRLKLTIALDNLFNYKPKYYYLNSPLTDGINLQIGLSLNLN